MGGELAVSTTNRGPVALHNFNDTMLLKLELRRGNWAIFGKVCVANRDSDPQHMSAKLVRDVNVIIDFAESYGEFYRNEVMALQTTLTVEEIEIVVLSCSTYNGGAEWASLIAIKVDAIQIQ